MVLDIVITLLSATLSFILSYLGFTASLHPPKKSDASARKRVKAKFIALGMVSVFLIILQGFRSGQTMNALMKNQNATVELTWIGPTNDLQPIIAGRQIAINLKLRSSTPITNLKSRSVAVVVDGSPTLQQQQIEYSEMENEVSAPIRQIGASQAAEYPWFVTTQTSVLSPEDARGLADGTKTLYVLGYVEWKNLSDSKSSLQICRYLQTPTEPAIVSKVTIWHMCIAHSSGIA